eukprot:jgi/Botrbrau1/729/Bobra.160_2s0052.1
MIYKWEGLGKALVSEAFSPDALGRGVRISLIPCFELHSPQFISVSVFQDRKQYILYNLADDVGAAKRICQSKVCPSALREGEFNCAQIGGRAGENPTPSSSPLSALATTALVSRYKLKTLFWTGLHGQDAISSPWIGILSLGYQKDLVLTESLKSSARRLATAMVAYVLEQMPEFLKDMEILSPSLPSYSASCVCCKAHPKRSSLSGGTAGDSGPAPHPHYPGDQSGDPAPTSTSRKDPNVGWESEGPEIDSKKPS